MLTEKPWEWNNHDSSYSSSTEHKASGSESVCMCFVPMVPMKSGVGQEHRWANTTCTYNDNHGKPMCVNLQWFFSLPRRNTRPVDLRQWRHVCMFLGWIVPLKSGVLQVVRGPNTPRANMLITMENPWQWIYCDLLLFLDGTQGQWNKDKQGIEAK